MHVVLVSFGTDGDVFPYLALAIALRGRGHRVTLVANEHFQAAAEAHDLGFRALVSNQESHELLSHPDFWHPLKAALVASRWGRKFIARQYDLLAGLVDGGEAVLVANPGVFAARLVQEKLGAPLATVLLQPALVQSIVAPPQMPGGLTLPRGLPGSIGRLYWRLVDYVGELVVGRELNKVRASLALEPVRNLFHWWLSPQRVIGLFPAWYGPPQPDWPAQLRLTGFPMYDGPERGGLPVDLEEFCRAGPPPIAFTFGTGMMHATKLFRAAVQACARTGARGVLLTRHAAQLPSPLPQSVRACAFAPFQQLFPHCSAVVHHGGVGTVAKALAAGTPQVVVPFAWDQPDNAARVRHLGAGDWVRPRQRTCGGLTQALARVMTPDSRARCTSLAERLRPGNGEAFDMASRLVEEISGALSTPARQATGCAARA